MNPDILSNLLVFVLRKAGAQTFDEAIDVTQNFPWILMALKQLFCDCMACVLQFFDFHLFQFHKLILLFCFIECGCRVKITSHIVLVIHADDIDCPAGNKTIQLFHILI